jgi:hypothetical protein
MNLKKGVLEMENIWKKNQEYKIIKGEFGTTIIPRRRK